MPTGEPGTVWMKMGAGDFEYKGDKDEDRQVATTPRASSPSATWATSTRTATCSCAIAKSDMIIAGGVNIYPAEIEAALLEHPDVGDAAVFGIPDDDMGEQIKAIIEPRAGVTADDALRESIMTHVQRAAREVQVAAHARLRRRAATRAHRQAVEAQAARPVLGRPRPSDLTGVVSALYMAPKRRTARAGVMH